MLHTVQDYHYQSNFIPAIAIEAEAVYIFFQAYSETYSKVFFSPKSIIAKLERKTSLLFCKKAAMKRTRS